MHSRQESELSDGCDSGGGDAAGEVLACGESTEQHTAIGAGRERQHEENSGGGKFLGKMPMVF